MGDGRWSFLSIFGNVSMVENHLLLLHLPISQQPFSSDRHIMDEVHLKPLVLDNSSSTAGVVQHISQHLIQY
ncbi:hypothetical protein T10_4677 [Trichinella papuae]|uniref:Uncharacterized protein n=1 Tax=Trichinella papuae TaxID=268474 RepID=A0A0V1MRK5_9BILA|nr:hypothetical protein T10_4677 [Trichinella papuae]